MPRWDFSCFFCDWSGELSFRNHEASKDAFCPKCGARVIREPAAPIFVLKGAGFHKNDYPSK
jgi:predicted nucleic acid-binding Zn ribbon protein